MYCPKCGLSSEIVPVLGKTRPEFVAELIVVAAATAVIVWLAVDARALNGSGRKRADNQRRTEYSLSAARGEK